MAFSSLGVNICRASRGTWIKYSVIKDLFQAISKVQQRDTKSELQYEAGLWNIW